MKSNQTIENLFRSYVNNECSAEEIKTLLHYFGKDKNEGLLKNLIREELEETDTSEIANDSLLEDAFKNIKNAIASQKKETTKPLLSLYLRPWFRMSAAAAVIIFLSATAYFLIPKKETISIAQSKIKVQPTDIAPGTNNAVLTLDNGKTIVLDSAANGTLAQQGNAKVLKLNGQITYNKTGDMNAKPVYNTITTEKGNEYELILADGSKVWLNAASSIRFPTAFAGNERKVEITGEAYFEVAHNASKSFKVEFNTKADGAGEIEVLGTHFDVNAYPDEENIKTTLLKGSVKIKRANQVQMLSPGQQAVLTSNTITLKKDVDVSQVVAWKDGFFVFNNTNIQTIMRQVARWYNIDVNFEGKISSDGFTGKISRNVPLSDFLKVLQLNNVHVNTEGRKVTIIS